MHEKDMDSRLDRFNYYRIRSLLTVSQSPQLSRVVLSLSLSVRETETGRHIDRDRERSSDFTILL